MSRASNSSGELSLYWICAIKSMKKTRISIIKIQVNGSFPSLAQHPNDLVTRFWYQWAPTRRTGTRGRETQHSCRTGSLLLCRGTLVWSFQILDYWKVSSNKYPILSLLAKDVLAVPASTVPSESDFSTGGCIIDPVRCSLYQLAQLKLWFARKVGCIHLKIKWVQERLLKTFKSMRTLEKV